MKILPICNRTIETTKGTVAKGYVETVLWIENGKTFPYREQKFHDKEETTYLDIMPKSSRKIVHVLNHLHIEPQLAEEQKPNRKTLTLTIKLNKKQEAELNRLKALCK